MQHPGFLPPVKSGFRKLRKPLLLVGKLLASLGGSNSHGRVYRPWGSDPTAAGGGRREGSEWQRSIKSRDSGSPKILSGTATGGAMQSIATQIRNLPVAGCHFTHGSKTFRIAYLQDSSTATATETVMPTMGLLPAPRKPIISTWAGTEEEPAN